MIDVTEIKSDYIKLRGVQFKDGEIVEQIMEICHKYKHMYKDGYPCGRKTRKERKDRLKRWAECPEICFTYLITNDTKDHHLQIKVLVSRTEALMKRYTDTEIEHLKQMYMQDVADEISILD